MNGGKQDHHHPDVKNLDLLLRDRPKNAANATISATKSNKTALAHAKLLHEQIGSGLDFVAASNINSTSRFFASFPTPTTCSLVGILHILFLYHWLLRKSRKDILVSYRVVVQKKQYHQVWLALLSHPPAKHQYRRQQSSSNLDDDYNNSDQDFQSRLRKSLRQSAEWAYRSGFALMLYNSHILWSCRALEVYYNSVSPNQTFGTTTKNNSIVGGSPQPQQQPSDKDANVMSEIIFPLQYARVLFSLTFVALVLELRLASLLLTVAERASGSDLSISLSESSETRPTNDEGSNHQRIRQNILYRSIGTLSALSCALLVVFQSHFEYVPLQVLPFFDNRWLLLGLSLPAAMTPFLCLIVLSILTMPSHPFTSTLYGLASGVFWSVGMTSFLQEAYWGNSLMVAAFIMSCASIKASGYATQRGGWTVDPASPAAWVPCIDFVSWNRRGERIRSLDDVRGGPNHTSSNLSEEEDETSQSTEDEDESTSEASSLHDDLYGRLPDLAENLEDEDMPSVREQRSERNPTMRSRRGVSNG